MTKGPRHSFLKSQLLVSERGTLLDAMRKIDHSGQTAVLVANKRGRVVGLVTDGDIRRATMAGRTLPERCLPDIMSRRFHSVTPGTSRAAVLDLMRAIGVDQVPIIDRRGRLQGLHLLQRLVGAVERDNVALIMAGGRGVRLGPITQNVPKPMLGVAGRPILERLVLHLVGYGIRRIYLAVNYLADKIESHFGDGAKFGCHIEYLRERKPLGTGGAISLLRERLKSPLLVLNGDLITQFNVELMLDFHERGGFSLTVGVRPFQMEVPFGVAEVRGSRLLRLQEKPTHHMLVNAGIYLLDPRLISLIPKNTEYPITRLIAACANRKRSSVGAHLIEDEWTDVGQPEELRRARGEY